MVGLIALGNQLIVQPAIEIQKRHIAAHAQEENGGDESQCCFICHPTHHQWIANNSASGIKQTVSTSYVYYNTSAAYPDPLIGSIFRPPLAF